MITVGTPCTLAQGSSFPGKRVVVERTGHHSPSGVGILVRFDPPMPGMSGLWISERDAAALLIPVEQTVAA